MNKLYEEILANKTTASEYMKKLPGTEEKSLFDASVRLLGAFTAAPGVSPNRILDHLAKENDGMKMIKTLVRDHHVGIDDMKHLSGQQNRKLQNILLITKQPKSLITTTLRIMNLLRGLENKWALFGG